MSEGCEGQTVPAVRLLLLDTESDATVVLSEPLVDALGDASRGYDYDYHFDFGPGGRVVARALCDGNGWLHAVGELAGDRLTLQTIAETDRVQFGGHTGASPVWRADGSTLWLGGSEVDSETGNVLVPFDSEAALWVHAELAEGARLVATWGADPHDFWLLAPEESADRVPERRPLFNGQSVYPAPIITTNIDGDRLAVVADPWSEEPQTYIIDASNAGIEAAGVRVVEGIGVLSPDGQHLLVRLDDLDQQGASEYHVLDIETGEAWLVPLEAPPQDWSQEVLWSGDGAGLFVWEAPWEAVGKTTGKATGKANLSWVDLL